VLRIKDTTFIAEAVTSIYTRGYILLKDKTINVVSSEVTSPKLLEKCGVVGISSISKEGVAEHLYKALYSLQHRGQEAAWHSNARGQRREGLQGTRASRSTC
jgi:hypothetical protein